MVECCSTIRTLSGVFAYFDGNIVLQLKELQASWDSDRRPILNDNSIIDYIDFKSHNLITTTKKSISLDSLDEKDLIIVHNYFEQMIPKDGL